MCFSRPLEDFHHGDALLEGVQELEDVLPFLLRELRSRCGTNVGVAVAIWVPGNDREDESASPREGEVLGAFDTIFGRFEPSVLMGARRERVNGGLRPFPCGFAPEFHHSSTGVQSFLASLVGTLRVGGQPVVVNEPTCPFPCVPPVSLVLPLIVVFVADWLSLASSFATPDPFLVGWGVSAWSPRGRMVRDECR